MRRALVRCAALTLAVGCRTPSAPAFDPAVFRDPPAALGPHVRWWWPGGAVDDPTIEAEVGRLAELGFAGIELQAMAMGLGPDDLAADPRVRTVGQPEQLARVRTFLAAAKARGLHTSLTLGSGWPSGGRFSVDVRPQELLLARVDVAGPTTVHLPVPAPTPPGWVAPVLGLFPVIGTFQPTATVVAVLLAPVVDADANPPVLGPPQDVTAALSAGTLDLTVPDGPHVVIFVQQHTVDHVVGGAAFPGVATDAKVVDHLDPRGAATLLAEQAGPWLDALAPNAPDEVFVDSFELVGELPWADDLDAAFEATWGYPIAPELPFVLRQGGESKYADILRPPAGPAYAADDVHGERVREDYEDLRGDLFRAAFIEPVAAFAADRHTALRLQAHGGYAPVLDAYTLADVPESEGLYAQGSMDFLELAASAAHVSGRTTVSSESFVSVNPLATPLSEDERWMLAGRAYVAGINRLMFHGAAYPYVRANGATWGPFVPDPAAGVVSSGPFPITSRFEPDSAEASTLPEFTLALTRLSYAMTRGDDVAEVAWLRADAGVRDVSFLRTTDLPPEQGESPTSLALRRAGYTYDRISPAMLAASSVVDGALRVGDATFPALLVTDWPSADPAEVAAVETAVNGGVPVFVRGALPTRARGLHDATARDAELAATVGRLAGRVVTVPTDEDLGHALADQGVSPSVRVASTTCPTLSLAHRVAGDTHIFLLFDEHPSPCHVDLELASGGTATLLDPLTGGEEMLPSADAVSIDLESRRPRVLVVAP